MSKLTHWEKSMLKSGYEIIPFTHEEIVEHLLDCFIRDREDLLTKAAADDTKRHTLCFVLDYYNIGDTRTIFGGTVTYNKKQRRFTHIAYSDNRNWGVVFSIESKATFFAYEHFKAWKKIFPFGASPKKLGEYLLNN